MAQKRFFLLAAAGCMILAACAKPDAAPEAAAVVSVPPPPLEVVLPNIPQPPESNPVNMESGSDATMLTFLSTLGADSIISFYREVLATSPFRLVSEQKAEAQTIFVAEQDGPALWVTVTPVEQGGGTLVAIAGGANLKKSTRDSSK